MKCIEAQSYIMPFINGKIPEAKQEEFVMHMKNCSKCHEELEIYYTLLKGMDQLNNSQKLSTDFNRDLENEMNRLVNKSVGRRTAKFSVFSLTILALGFVMAIFYGDCINRVYSFEQDTKWANQGNYYFLNQLGDDFLLPEEDLYKKDRKEAEISNHEVTIYEKIKAFHLVEEHSSEILQRVKGIDYGKIITYRWK